MSELCRKYGVSRPTGYAWVKRFRDAAHDLRALEEKSRRPLSNPQAVQPQTQAPRALPAEKDPPARAATDAAVCEHARTERHLVHRFQGQVSHAGRAVVPRAHAARRGHAVLDSRRGDARSERQQRGEGPRLRVSGIRAAEGDALRQRAAVCLDGSRAALETLGVVAEARHQARAHRARQAAAEWPPRTLTGARRAAIRASCSSPISPTGARQPEPEVASGRAAAVGGQPLRLAAPSSSRDSATMARLWTPRMISPPGSRATTSKA